jgi:hypothetical protein
MKQAKTFQGAMMLYGTEHPLYAAFGVADNIFVLRCVIAIKVCLGQVYASIRQYLLALNINFSPVVLVSTAKWIKWLEK